MKRYVLFVSLIVPLFFFSNKALAQTDQVVANGMPITPVSFTNAGCTYNWTNNLPGVGLAASGTGDIASFNAVNSSNSQVVATINATPVQSGFAYFADYWSNTVAVVNTITDKVVASIQVGNSPAGVSVSPDGSRVYVANQSDGTVSVINTITNTVLATVDVGISPLGICVSPDGKWVYVGNENPGTISVINAATNTVTTTFPVGGVYGLATSPDGSLLYISMQGQIAVVNTSSFAVINTISVGTYAGQIAVSPNGKQLYVPCISNTNPQVGSVYVVDVLTGTVSATIPIGSSAMGISVSPDRLRLYVTNGGENTISVINTSSNSVVTNISVGSTISIGISISPDGSKLYVGNSNSNAAIVISTATNSIIGTIGGVGPNPSSIGNFVSGGTGCTGSPIKFTITVNPTPALAPTIVVGTASGAITACSGSASVSPNIQQFTVSGSNLTNSITVTATTNFEVSINSGSGYANNLTLSQTAGVVNSAIVYVRSTAAASTGNISGNVTLASPGATTQTVAVAGAVNALPTVNQVNPQTVNNGAASNAINFTGTGSIFSWTNDTPGIGLAASGLGDIPSFTAVNTGNAPVVATINVTPKPEGYAYITSISLGNVSVINTATNAVIATIAVGSQPQGVYVSRDGSKVYVVNNGSNNVSVIDIATNTVIATILVGSLPSAITESRDGTELFVANVYDNTVSVISAATNKVYTSGTGPDPIDHECKWQPVILDQ